jgi:regulation of enolase protein 1 (concanavalin A-like superfamily)
VAASWGEGRWLNEPDVWRVSEQGLHIVTEEGSGFWRETSYGFTRDSGHALLFDFPDDSSVECTFHADFSQEFDQAGVMVWGNDANWIKAGVEYADGVWGMGAVVTRDLSDWSTGPHPDWAGQPVTLRVSRSHGAVTIRARSATGSWELVRLAPLDPTVTWQVGPYAASPSRKGLNVTFTHCVFGLADASLHS